MLALPWAMSMVECPCAGLCGTKLWQRGVLPTQSYELLAIGAFAEQLWVLVWTCSLVLLFNSTSRQVVAQYNMISLATQQHFTLDVSRKALAIHARAIQEIAIWSHLYCLLVRKPAISHYRTSRHTHVPPSLSNKCQKMSWKDWQIGMFALALLFDFFRVGSNPWQKGRMQQFPLSPMPCFWAWQSHLSQPLVSFSPVRKYR